MSMDEVAERGDTMEDSSSELDQRQDVSSIAGDEYRRLHIIEWVQRCRVAEGEQVAELAGPTRARYEEALSE